MLKALKANTVIDGAMCHYSGFGADSQTQLLYAFVAARLSVLNLSVSDILEVDPR